MQKNPCYPTAGIIVVLIILFQSCSHTPTPYVMVIGDWIKLGESGLPRSEAVSFTIGDSVYIGTGYNGTKQLSDFWCYNTQSNLWTQKANFPGAARSSAVAFSIGQKGYVGTGYDGNKMLNDFYSYDVANDSWDSIAAFAGTPRYDAVAFAIGGYAYLATGYDGTYQNDFWQFNPAAGPYGGWVQQANFGGQGRSAAVAFVQGTKAYIVTGVNNGVPCGDFWCYNTTAAQWTQLRNIYNSDTLETYDHDYTDIERENGVGFVIGDSAFIATGTNSKGLLNTSWTYNISQDQWVRRAPFPVLVQGSIGFAINGYGYIAAGKTNAGASGYLNTLIKFDPNKLYNPSDY